MTAICAALVTGAAAQPAEPPVLKLMTEPQAQDIELDPDQPIAIDPDTGNITIFPASPTQACQGGGCDDVQVQISEFLPTGTIERFSSQSLSVSWSTRGAWECRGQGSPGLADTAWVTEGFVLPPTRPAGNPFTFDLSTVPTGTHTLTLQCQNGPLTTRRQVSRTLEIVQVTAGDCTGRNPPSNLVRHTKLLQLVPNQTTRLWNDFFGNVLQSVEFPDGTTNTLPVRINRNRYGQLDFTTVNLQPGQRGSFDLTTVVKNSDAQLGRMILSISECPGDFGPALDDACRKVVRTTTGVLLWAERSAARANLDCPLDPDKEYFFNLVPAMELPETQNPTWNCEGSKTVNACEAGMRLVRD